MLICDRCGNEVLVWDFPQHDAACARRMFAPSNIRSLVFITEWTPEPETTLTVEDIERRLDITQKGIVQ